MERRELKAKSYDIKRAAKISRFVLGSLERGVVDMPARTRRLPYITTYAQVSPEVGELVQSNLAPLEVEIYSKYVGFGDNEARIRIVEA